MAIYRDIADWIGPTANRVAHGMGDAHGVVLHIQEGTEAGTEAWQRNPASQVSSHFLAPRSGRLRQMVDTADRAWCEAAGNSHWWSIEIEGHAGDHLTADQVESCAQVLARAHRDEGVPLAVSNNPYATSDAEGGLGYHAMGGQAWGGHFDCPGTPIIAARSTVVTRARQITSPVPAPAKGGDRMIIMAHERGSNVDWIGNGIFRWPSPDPAHTANAKWFIAQTGGNATSVEINPGTLDALGPIVVSSAGGVPTVAAVALSDTQMTQLAAAVVASHPALSDADAPAIEAAVRDVLHGA